MDPLYYYRLDLETGTISQQTITDYEVVESRHYWTNRSTCYYKWKDRSQLKRCYESDLDRFKNNHVYTFNPDPTKARQLIVANLQARADKAYKDYKSLVATIDQIQRGELI